MAEKIGVCKQAIEMQIANPKAKEYLSEREQIMVVTGALFSNHK